MEDNPFINTKASYFDDNEIEKYWVELTNDDNILEKIVEPESSIPIRILGGKGIGKTHVLRHFSFQTQKIRSIEKGFKTYLEYIQISKYLGIYMSINGLKLNRFSGHGITNEEWGKVFYYYINLEFVEKTLRKLEELFMPYSHNLEKPFNIEALFKNEKYSISTLLELVHKQRIDIDERVSKISMPFADVQKIMSGIEPIFSIELGSLDIIQTVLNNFAELTSVKILFIIDEFENATNHQQRFYNSLLRHPDKDKLKQIGIRIAGRLSIETALDTLDDNEKLLEGSEINTIYLEDYYKNFSNFSKKLYRKRIESLNDTELQNIKLENNFQTSKICNDDQLRDLSDHVRIHKKKYYLEVLKESLSSNYSQEEITKILHNIQNDNLLHEKMNVFICYKNWNKDLIQVTTKLSNEINADDYSMHIQQNKFEIDMIYQLFREYRKKYYISGYENILTLSNNNPRIFLAILSEIFKESIFNKVDLFHDIVNCKIQHNALLKASTWFWDNFTEDVPDNKVLWAVNEICAYFREARQSPKPSEKTMISFSYFTNDVSESINELVDMAVYHSLLIENKRHHRKGRNSSKLERQLRIHPMLAPKWELSFSVGGTTNFSKEDMEALFLNKTEEWKDIKKTKIDRLYPVFKNIKKKNNSKKSKLPNLFDEEI